jgi:SAM-dependent methyltransferase
MLKRAVRAFRRHGFRKFWALLGYNAAYYLRRLGRREEPDTAGRSLDDSLGVETTAIRETGSLEIDSRNVAQAVRYQPSGVSLVRETLRGCDIDYSGFVFIDFGCGKGRVMLLAAELPFRKVMGVEFSEELHRIAQNNIAAALNRIEGCRDVRAILGDAADFDPPDDPLVCYFYNPFGEALMREVVGNIERSLRKTWRKVLIIYVEPLHRHVFDDSRWSVIRQDHRHVVYQNYDRP